MFTAPTSWRNGVYATFRQAEAIMPKPIIDPTAQLTFSSYYDLPYTIAQVAQHFGYTLNKTYLDLPQAYPKLMPKIADEAQALQYT